MKFIVDKNGKLNKNKVIMNLDHSYETLFTDKEPWHFQVSLTKWGDILLNFNKNTKKCVSCEGYFFEDSNRVHIESINIPNYIEASLLFDSTEIPNYGIEMLLEDQVIHFDKEKNFIAYGDISSHDNIFKFGEGQYVKIKDGKITTIYIMLHLL